jgi:hypothetical protein
MTTRQHWTFGFVVAALVLLGTVNADAQPTGVGPYYATPSWDQTFPSASRFMILSNFANSAILDRETGLVWERSPDTTPVGWFGAIVACTTRTLGSRKAWRLPSVHELASLIDPSVTFPGPTLPVGHPFLNIPPSSVTSPGFFWTATETSDPPSLAWAVFLGDGSLATYEKTSNSFRAWCVRGASQEHHY